MYYSVYASPIGVLYLVSDGEYLLGSYTKEQKNFPKDFNFYEETSELDIFIVTKLWLDNYFFGKMVSSVFPKIKFEGTEFQCMVWSILRDIPFGNTTSYKKISEEYCLRTGKKTMSVQAIGNAIGRNPLLVFIPCHRVLSSEAKLTGFSAGIENKKLLLDLEKSKYKE